MELLSLCAFYIILMEFRKHLLMFQDMPADSETGMCYAAYGVSPTAVSIWKLGTETFF